jgi:hypothetical protein
MVYKAEINRRDYDTLLLMVQSMGPHSELECKCKSFITKDEFITLLQYFRSIGYAEILNEEVLDIFVNDNRLSLTGGDAISKYCKTNIISSASNVIGITKLQQMPPLFLDEFDFKVDLKTETPMNDLAIAEMITRLPNMDKAFRYKKRYSYMTEGMRYDFTIVRASRRKETHKLIASSGVLSAAETYEVEIEVVHPKDVPKPIKRGRKVPVVAQLTHNALVDKIFQGMVVIYMLVNGETHYLPKDARKSILQNYLHLVFGNSVREATVKETPREYLAAPQPVPLEKKHLLPPDLGVLSIQKDYTVTEKADGERSLLYISNNGMCCTLNSRLQVKFLGVKVHNLVNTLLDGEVVTRDILGNKVCMYAIFDVYFHNGQDVRNKPLVGGRLDIMNEIEKKIAKRFEEDGGIKIFCKKFLHGDGLDIFRHAKTILDSAHQLPYKIDGLIFTPALLAVGARYVGEKAPNTFGTWDRTLKYKPPEENTVDFLVKYGMLNAAPPAMVRELELYVGYNPMQWERIKPINYVEGTLVHKRQHNYMAKRFEPPGDPPASALVKVNDDKTIRCLNNDAIENNSVVEFMWNGGGWVPTRVRRDKTELLRKQGLSRTANDIKTALSIWKCIKDPITYDIITGATLITSVIEDDEDTYYFRNIARDKMATKPMLDFHNYWIKNVQLIKRFKGDSIFDIACGKAGDLNKWIDAGYKKIVGVDYSRDNIENPIDGAYARTLKRREVSNGTFLYLPLDGGKRFEDEYFKAIEDEDTRKIARVAWGYEKAKPGNRIATFYRFINPSGFKTVSCQFAIHYFYKDMVTLDNFIFNVNKHLAPGGHFFGTCLDGKRIKKAFQDAAADRLIGEKDGRVLWMIQKMGDNEIDVYMESIGKRTRETLVDFDVLVNKLDAYNINLVQPITSFEDAYNQLAATESKEAIVNDSILKMSPEEKKYSFLNSYFVFQKKASI